MDIKEIKETYDLYRTATACGDVLVKDLAKELGVKVTELMKFIQENPKLFRMREVWSYKTKTVESIGFGGHKFKDRVQVKDRCRGLGISGVYLDPADNSETEEWLLNRQAEYAKTIWLSGWNNYGRIEGYYVRIDGNDSKQSRGLWRNTQEKVDALRSIGALRDMTFFVGGFGDCSEHPVHTAMDSECIMTAKESGWTVMNEDTGQEF